MKIILLVEDDEVIKRSLAELLTDSDDELRVIAVANGREAINILHATAVDLVVTDLNMPVLDGFSLLAHMMRVHPSTPVVVITAYGTPDARKRLKGFGADYLEKPADLKALPALVRAKLGQRAKGHIEGITLEGLLQILNLERKSCGLVVKSRGRSGQLTCVSGDMVHAHVGVANGLDAAYTILSWEEPEIEIEGTPSMRERTIDVPLHHILMEAARLKDEAARARDSGVRFRTSTLPDAKQR